MSFLGVLVILPGWFLLSNEHKPLFLGIIEKGVGQNTSKLAGKLDAWKPRNVSESNLKEGFVPSFVDGGFWNKFFRVFTWE